MSRTLSSLLIFLATLALQAFVMLMAAVNCPPDFYHPTLLVSHDQYARSGAALEALVDDFLKQASRGDGPFKLQLTDEQLNGWLAVELPKQVPAVLPTTLKDPRVAIGSNGLQVACRYHDFGTQAMLNMSMHLAKTEQPNEIRLRVLEATIGSVPGLEHEAVRPIAHVAWRSGMRLKWLERERNPEAIAQLPARWLGEARQLQIDHILFEPGSITIEGRIQTQPTASPAKKSRGGSTRTANEIGIKH